MEGMGMQRSLFVAFRDVETACFRNGARFFFPIVLHHRAALRSIPLSWLLVFNLSRRLSLFPLAVITLDPINGKSSRKVDAPLFPVHLTKIRLCPQYEDLGVVCCITI
jgi:hypothetical protein